MDDQKVDRKGGDKKASRGYSTATVTMAVTGAGLCVIAFALLEAAPRFVDLPKTQGFLYVPAAIWICGSTLFTSGIANHFELGGAGAVIGFTIGCLSAYATLVFAWFCLSFAH